MPQTAQAYTANTAQVNIKLADLRAACLPSQTARTYHLPRLPETPLVSTVSTART